MNKSNFVTVSSNLLTLSPNTSFGALTDNNGSSAAIQFVTATAQNQQNKELFRLTFNQPIQLEALYIKKTSSTQIFGGTVMLQGSGNGSTW
jgi:hypothetical protein